LYLTRYEEAMFNGEYGEIPQKAIRILVKVGEVFGADKLVRVNHVHISGISYFNIGDPGLEFIESFANAETKFATYTTANPYAILVPYRNKQFRKEIILKQSKIIRALAKMGAKAFTCAPYYIRKPSPGEHIAWAESNAVLYANSVVGAHTNREGGPLAFFEAIIGETYFSGVHLYEGRIPECYISIEKPTNYVESALLGYKVGETCPDKIPYVEGLANVSEPWLRAFLSAFGATSGAPMVVIEGVTPHYRKLLSDSGLKSKIFVSLSSEELSLSKGLRSPEEAIYIIGCPHLSLKEIKDIVSYLLNNCRKRTDKNKELWLITGPYSANAVYRYENELRDRGIRLLYNSCPVVTRLDLLGIKYVITDSGKALYYLPKLAGVRALIKDRLDILREFCGGKIT